MGTSTSVVVQDTQTCNISTEKKVKVTRGGSWKHESTMGTVRMERGPSAIEEARAHVTSGNISSRQRCKIGVRKLHTETQHLWRPGVEGLCKRERRQFRQENFPKREIFSAWEQTSSAVNVNRSRFFLYPPTTCASHHLSVVAVTAPTTVPEALRWPRSISFQKTSRLLMHTASSLPPSSIVSLSPRYQCSTSLVLTKVRLAFLFL